jgi:cytochrome P450
VEEVLVTQQRAFVKGSIVRGLRRLLGNGLVTSDGALWLRQRRLLQPAFHRERVASYGQQMVRSAEHRLAGWQDGPPRELYHEMAELTLANVTRALFGADVVGESGEVTAALLALAHEQRGGLGDLQLLLPDWLPTPANWRRRRTVRRLDAIVYRLIDQRRASQEDRADLLSLLLQARYEDGSRMDPRQLRDEALTFFLAGHDTTAIALAWTWYLLARHPRAEARLHAELADVLGDRSPGVADLPRLPYAGGVVAEALRLYPPAWALARVAVRDCSLLGTPIRAGTAVLFSQWVLHRDPRFFAEPERFDPERWTDDRAAQLPRGAYFPFGAGPRLCIGNTFALMQATLLLATIAQRFRLAPAPGAPPVRPRPDVVLRPEPGVWLVPRPR